jgi:hypothetical protein
VVYAKRNTNRSNKSKSEYILEEEEFKIKLQAAIASLRSTKRIFLMNS